MLHVYSNGTDLVVATNCEEARGIYIALQQPLIGWDALSLAPFVQLADDEQVVIDINGSCEAKNSREWCAANGWGHLASDEF